MEAAAAINLLIQLVTLAEEASVAAGRISKLIADNKGQPISEEQWKALLSERAVAQTLFAASIARAQTERA